MLNDFETKAVQIWCDTGHSWVLPSWACVVEHAYGMSQILASTCLLENYPSEVAFTRGLRLAYVDRSVSLTIGDFVRAHHMCRRIALRAAVVSGSDPNVRLPRCFASEDQIRAGLWHWAATSVENSKESKFVTSRHLKLKLIESKLREVINATPTQEEQR